MTPARDRHNAVSEAKGFALLRVVLWKQAHERRTEMSFETPGSSIVTP